MTLLRGRRAVRVQGRGRGGDGEVRRVVSGVGAVAGGVIKARAGRDILPVGLTETGQIDQAREQVVSRMRRFIDAAPSKEVLTFRRIITELFALLEAFDVRTTLAAWMSLM